MWTNKVKSGCIPNNEEYGVMILAIQYLDFGFGYTLTVPYLQNVNEYCYIHPKYVDTDTETTTLVNIHKENITMEINHFYQ